MVLGGKVAKYLVAMYHFGKGWSNDVPNSGVLGLEAGHEVAGGR